MAGKRIFNEVNVGNFHGQKGRQRIREHGDQERPRIAHWRNNLTALSHDFDLYFVAFGDKIHITKPLGLHQTLPSAADLILDLPQSPQGVSVGGYIDQVHPHDVNNMKVGMLGEFEILLIACDDGDLIAYYTRLLEREIKVAGSSPSESPISHIRPFFHDNVGISAWGLAIHQVSRLIAVGTNHREVTVFQPGLAVAYDPDTGSRYYQERTGNSWPGRSFPAANSPFTPVWKLDFGSDALGDFERKDCRLRLPLGSSGSNVPSIDFVSDQNGEASVVLATDVNGKLWSLDLTQRETLEWPEIHQLPYPLPDSDDEFEPRGWGVLCIPTSCFILVQSPQEALGVENLEYALDLNTDSSTHCLQSIDISCTLPTVGNSSTIHPSCAYFVKLPQTSLNTLELDRDPTLPLVRTTLSWNIMRSYVLGLLNSERTKHLVQQPRNIPGFQSDDWARSMIDLLLSNRCSEAVEEWVEETHQRVGQQWKGGKAFHEAIKALQFLLHLPLMTRYRIKTWEGLLRLLSTEDFEKEILRTPGLSQTQWMSIGKKKQAIPRLQEGRMAVIRTSAHDIELISPDPNMLNTICRNFLRQTLPHEHTQDILDRFDRLNMFTVIPELSLLVVASQKGRVGLFTLTRLADDFSEVGPVLMMRLDRILPFTEHETEFRPNVPLLGVAVGPLQGRNKEGGVQRKIWRLLLHYMDHTVLSYELSRGSHGLEFL